MTEELLLLTDEELVTKTNNFWTKLPDDIHPAVPGEPKIRPGYMRTLDVNNGCLDQRFSDRERDYHPHTNQFLAQTRRYFYLTIDELVEELGIREFLAEAFAKGDNPKRLLIARKSYEIAIGDDRIPYEKRLKEAKRRGRLGRWKTEASLIAVPVFRKMLEMGYNYYDLAP